METINSQTEYQGIDAESPRIYSTEEKKSYFRRVLFVSFLQMLLIIIFICISLFDFVDSRFRNSKVFVLLGALIVAVVVLKETRSDTVKTSPACYVVSAAFSFFVSALISLLFDSKTQPSAFYFFGSLMIVILFIIIYDFFKSEEPNQGDLCKVILPTVFLIGLLGSIFTAEGYLYFVIIELIVLVISWSTLGLFIGEVEDGKIDMNWAVRGAFLVLFR